MSILFTSFGRSKNLDIQKFSCAVYQPKGFNYPKVDWTDIRREGGHWTRPRDFISAYRPLDAYREALWQLYSSREKQIYDWLYKRSGDIALCCWCPYDRAAQRQLQEHGSFVCHTAVLGLILEHKFHQVVAYDSDREKMVKW